MVTYKTKDGTLTGFLPGVGQIVDGKVTVPDSVVIENANLEREEDQLPQPPPVAPVATPPAAPVIPAVPAEPVTPPAQAPPVNDQPLNKESE